MRNIAKALLVFAITVFFLNGCTQPLEEGLPEGDQYHSTGWQDNPQHGNEFSTNPQNCKACHGEDLEGGLSGASCVPCHHPLETPNFHHGGTIVHIVPEQCDGCHGENLTGGHTNTSCFACHPDREKCAPCHRLLQSHTVHTVTDGKGPGQLACEVCHDQNPFNYVQLADGNDLSGTELCDTCHSPGGAFDGVDDSVIGAKTNWDDGIYEENGTALKSGNEQWCATCHDDEPAFSKPEIPDPPIVIDVVDNPDAEFGGEDWTCASGKAGAYNDDDCRHEAGDGSSTATWRPNIAEAGNYSVYAWWRAGTTRATDAKYTIYYDGGPETIEVNQKSNGSHWNYLGTFNFAAGTSGYVVLSDDANGYVFADAIKLESGDPDPGTYAPNVIGDNATYGFYVTGHKIACLSCHDASKNHIDGEHRTYEQSEGIGVVNPYCDSYRLKDIDGQPAMNLPRPMRGNIYGYLQDFALCFDCHNSNEVLGDDLYDVSHTNFWNDDGSIENSHNLHLGMTGKHFDSDWDGTKDSTESCIACHNVHGSPTKAMIRHGELISTNRNFPAEFEALNFSYLVPSTDPPATATWTPNITDAGDYKVYAWWSASPNRATNAKYTVYYDGGGSETHVVDQEINGGQWNELTELSGPLPFAAGTSGYVVLSNEDANEYVIADATRWEEVLGPGDIIMDNPQATYVGTWPSTSANPDKYGADIQYHAKPTATADPAATLADSVGGRFNWAGNSVSQNGVCTTGCHGAMSYERTPYLGCKVLNRTADPDTVPNDGSGTSLITVFISDPDGDVSGVEIDLTPIGGSANQAMNDDGGGYYSYLVTIPATTPDSPLTFEITATDLATNTGEGEVTLIVVDPDSIYVDNPDAEFVCTWGTSPSGGYNDDYRWHAAGSGSCTATWTPDLTADTYSVYAWWKASSNRATDAPYTIYYDGGSETKDMNQKTDGGQWNLLGTYPFTAGASGYVVLSDDANQYVIADAIKWEPEPLP